MITEISRNKTFILRVGCDVCSLTLEIGRPSREKAYANLDIWLWFHDPKLGDICDECMSRWMEPPFSEERLVEHEKWREFILSSFLDTCSKL
jgi:hypothetical protein